MEIKKGTPIARRKGEPENGVQLYEWDSYGANSMFNRLGGGDNKPTLAQLNAGGYLLWAETVFDPLTHKLAEPFTDSWQDDGIYVTPKITALTNAEIAENAENAFGDRAHAITDALQTLVHQTAWDVGKYGHLGVGNIYNCSSYIGIGSPYEEECVSLLSWNSAVWVKCNEILAEVLAGERPEPTTEEVIAELPKYGEP